MLEETSFSGKYFKMPVNDKKRAYAAKLTKFLLEYQKVFIVSVDNVGSKQMQQVRMALRGRAEILMGKNVSIACQ